ncbi:MAG TPA: hypothetical protein V6C89_00910 [Drouetiella sp.]
MKLMRAKKQSAPVAIACIIAATSTAALASNLGSPGSALDPNNYVAPVPTKPVKAPRADSSLGGEPEEVQSTTTFVTMPGFESNEPTAQKAAKAKPAPTSDGNGLLSGVNDKFKSAGSGIASGTKAAGDSMKKGTKAVGDGIASGAKASGNFFIKGARAIGTGTKKMGSKVAQGAKAAGDTVKDGTHAVADKLPFTGGGKSDKLETPKAVASKPAPKQEDLKPADGGDKIEPAQPQVADVKPEVHGIKPDPNPKMRLVTEDIGTGKPGLVGKTLGTFGKLNVFHKKGGAGGLETAGKAPTGAAVIH